MSRERRFDPAHDRIPAPEATELNSDTSWILFEDLEVVQDPRHAEAHPLGRVGTMKGGGAWLPRKMKACPIAESTLAQLLESSREQRRACPSDVEWARLYRLLAASAKGYAAAPPPPLTGPAGRRAAALEKRACFRAQLAWAAAHGCIWDAKAFLAQLAPGQWEPL